VASEIPNSAQKKIEIDQSKVNPDNINGNQEKNHETAKKQMLFLQFMLVIVDEQITFILFNPCSTSLFKAL